MMTVFFKKKIGSCHIEIEIDHKNDKNCINGAQTLDLLMMMGEKEERWRNGEILLDE